MAHTPRWYHRCGHDPGSRTHNHPYAEPIPGDEVFVLAGGAQRPRRHQECSRSAASHYGLVGGMSSLLLWCLAKLLRLDPGVTNA